MNTLLSHTDPRETVDRTRPVRDRPSPAEPRRPVPSKRTEATSSYSATTAPQPHANTWIRWLSRDANSPDLVNFPFAFTVSMILMTGLTVMGWGITITGAWLTVVGFLITLGGMRFLWMEPLRGLSMTEYETFAGFRFKRACPAPLPARASRRRNHSAPNSVADLRPTSTEVRASQALNKNEGGAG